MRFSIVAIVAAAATGVTAYRNTACGHVLVNDGSKCSSSQ